MKYQKSDLAKAIEGLGQVANNFISAHTQRQTQLAREKTAREIESYNYLIKREDKEIDDIEASLDTLVTNLEQKSIELSNINPKYQGVSSAELLSLAGESNNQMLNTMLNDAKNQKNSYKNNQ